MTRNVQVNAQTNSVPSVGGRITISVHVSAGIDTGSGTDPAVADDRGYLVPWHWIDATGQPWKASLDSSWVVFRQPQGSTAFSVVNGITVVPVQTANAGDAFVDAVDKMVWGAGSIFVPADFELPAAGAPVTRSTLYGFIGSLPTLPAPYPASLSVWTCITITDPAAQSSDRFFALPVFGPPGKGGSYYKPAVHSDPVTGNPIFELQKQTAPGQTLLDATVPPPPAPVAADGAGRLIDVTTFAIRALPSGANPNDNWAATGDQNWITTLPNRLAAALDPAVRTMGVFDAAAREFFQGVANSANPIFTDPARASAALSALRGLLDGMHWLIYSPATIGAVNIAPPAVAAFAAITAAGQNSSDADAVAAAAKVPIALAALSDRDTFSLAAPFAPAASFHVLSRGRLETLSDLKFAGGPVTESVIDGDEAFRDWLLEHWLLDRWPLNQKPPAPVPPRPLAANTSRDIFKAWRRRWAAGQDPLGPPTIVQSLLSLSALAKVGDLMVIPLTVEAKAPLPAELTATFAFDGFTAAAQPPAVKLHIQAAASTLSIAGGASVPVALPGVDAAVQLSIARTANGFNFTVSAAAPGGAAATLPPISWNVGYGFAGGMLTVKATVGSFANVAVTADSVAQALAPPRLGGKVPSQALRALLSRNFAGTYLPALLAGDGVAPTANPPDRITKGYLQLVDVLYPAVFKLVSTTLTPAALQDIKSLVDDIQSRAMADAKARAATLLPTATIGARLTPRATPLVLPVDQIDPFSDDTDLWTHFSGITAIVGRADDPQATFPAGNQWYSLNVADLRLRSQQAADGSFPDAAFQAPVDPVPLQIGEIGGVRQATISYDARSIVAQMPSDVTHDQAGATAPASTLRRLEAYTFSGRLPALTAGKPYFFFLSVVGMGGSLTPLLRKIAGDPTLCRSDAKGQSFLITLNEFQANGVDACIRKAIYLRTTAVGAPRLDVSASVLPGILQGLSPLAAELPLRPGPVSLEVGTPSTFYLDAAGNGGSLEFPSASATAIQIDISPINSRPAGATTTLSVLGINGDDPGPPVVLLQVAIGDAAWPAAGTLGLRLTAGDAGVALWQELPRSPKALAEDATPYQRLPQAIAAAVPLAMWRAFAVQLELQGPPIGTTFECAPPLVSFGSAQRPAADANAYAIDNTMPRLPSESAYQSRDITVLDGINTPSSRTAAFVLRRPATDFGTWERWINWNIQAADGAAIRNQIDEVYRHLVKDSERRRPNEDTTVDDPAVVAIAAELIEIFPTQSLIQAPTLLSTPFAALSDIINENKPLQQLNTQNRLSFALTVGDKRGAAKLDSTGATLIPGHIYEIRFYGLVPIVQSAISTLPTEERVAWPVRQALRRLTIGGTEYFLGAPLVRTVEVATDELPVLYTSAPWSLSIAPSPTKDAATAAIIRLDPGFTRSADTYGPIYRLLRYCDQASLFVQQWSWRGRPLPSELPDFGAGHLPVSAVAPESKFEPIAFLDRRDDDVGVIEQRRLVLANILNDQDKPDDTTWPARAVIFNKDLGYGGGAQWWRFGLKLTSRYAPLRPGSDSLSTYSHLSPSAQADAKWHSLVVCDHPVGRMPNRPALALVLPLTETVMDDGVVPPLLAIFSEPMFAGGNIGDTIEAAVEYVRHPLPGPGVQKLLPQRGPDSTLSADGSDGTAVAVRLDGPLGYTFDVGTEAPRFNNSGFLLTPLASGNVAKVPPWSMIKLQFRRVEAIEFSAAPRSNLDQNQNYMISLPDPAPASLDGGPSFAPAGPHEGLVVDFGTIGQSGNVTISPARYPTRPPAAADIGRSIGIKITRPDETLSLDFTADLGEGPQSAGNYTCALPATASAGLRLVISQRDKPQDGEAPYTPVIDVSVRLLKVNAIEDGLVNSSEGAWLTVACLPLLAGGQYKPSDPVLVNCKAAQFPAAPIVVPARLSQFTSALWCQFAQDASRVTMQVVGQGPDKLSEVKVASLAAVPGPTGNPALKLRGSGADLSSLQDLTGLTTLQSTNSQMQTGVAVVVTRYVTDAFAQLREEPTAVYEIVQGANINQAISLKPTWPQTQNVSKPGRIRLISFMRSTLVSGMVPSFPLSFFGALNQTIETEPLDAPGRVIGISKPIDWPGTGKA